MQRECLRSENSCRFSCGFSKSSLVTEENTGYVLKFKGMELMGELKEIFS